MTEVLALAVKMLVFLAFLPVVVLLAFASAVVMAWDAIESAVTRR